MTAALVLHLILWSVNDKRSILNNPACSSVRRKLEEMEREHDRSREEEERLHKEVRNKTLRL